MATRRKTGPASKKPLNRFGRDLERELERAHARYPTLISIAQEIGTEYQRLYGYMRRDPKAIPAWVVEALRDALDIPADRLRVTDPPERVERDLDPPGLILFRAKYPKSPHIEELRAQCAKIGPEGLDLERLEELAAFYDRRDRGKTKPRPELDD